MLSLYRKFIKHCAETGFVQRALAADIDLSCMARRPTAREQFGIFILLLSYILGWPAVAGFALLAMYLNEPLVLVVGGPSIYGFSHLLFFAGIYLAGKEYARVLLKWSLKKAFAKMLATLPDKAQTS